ncbi:MAG TPA: CdaR family protein [Chloroflexota bacterium]|nr:CdaR family protein [Chloroflexota bacterium]
MVPFLRSNLVWMLLSLVLSTGLWVFVTFNQDPEVTNSISNIPVQIQGAPKTLVVQSETQTVTAVLSAPSDVWPQLRPDKLQATIDASKVAPGLQEVPVKVTSSDPRARIETVEPAKIFLQVQPLETKKVPVEATLTGSVAFGYESGAAKTTPTTVTISGPQSNVDQVTAVQVAVSLDGLTDPIDRTYKPIAVNNAGAPVDRITIDPDGVLVEIPIDQKIEYKTLPVEPTIVGNVALGYQEVGVTVDPQTVTLVGDPTTLQSMSTVPTQPISVTDATGDVAVNADLALPKTVALARSQTIVVRVLVSTITGSKTILVSPQVINAAPTVAYALNPGAVSVTLSGPIPVLTRLQPNDLTVTVDAGGAVSGSTKAKVQVVPPPLLKVVGVQPDTVTLSTR